MKLAKDDVPARIDTPTAVARQQMGFGSARGYDDISGEYFTLGAGTDLTPLLEGLEDDMCQCPHWGFVLEGKLSVRYTDESNETDEAGDLFYWPPGHTVTAEEDSEMILFSPQDEHAAVLDHIAGILSTDA